MSAKQRAESEDSDGAEQVEEVHARFRNWHAACWIVIGWQVVDAASDGDEEEEEGMADDDDDGASCIMWGVLLHCRTLGGFILLRLYGFILLRLCADYV